ncbi:hypothetical protein HDE_06590 [Halotydeus destructor]|nr:hypothetical protein HDE_06590 [Halotydeus destructor]
MLKNPHAVKGDAGVDDTVAVNGSEAVPKSSQQHESETILSNVHSLVSSVYGYGYGALIDGRRGSCRSYTDSEGNHYSVTVKSIGSRSYTVTEKTSLTGLKEKTEEFENMSERDIKLFEEEFNGQQSSSNYIRVLYDYVPSASDTRRLKNYIVDNMPKWF